MRLFGGKILILRLANALHVKLPWRKSFTIPWFWSQRATYEDGWNAGWRAAKGFSDAADPADYIQRARRKAGKQ